MTLVDTHTRHFTTCTRRDTDTPFGMQDNYARYEVRWNIRLQHVDDENARGDRNEAAVLVKILPVGVAVP